MTSTATQTEVAEPQLSSSRDRDRLHNALRSTVSLSASSLDEDRYPSSFSIPIQYPSSVDIPMSNIGLAVFNSTDDIRGSAILSPRIREQPSGEALFSRLVAFDKPSDPLNPKDWSMAAKFSATVIVSGFAFLSPVASSMVAPALPPLAADLHITTSIEEALVLSIFLLAYAIGPLLIGPLSEIYGRVPVLQLSNLFFIIFNMACGFCQTPAQIIICRFLAGIGGAAPISIAGGVIGDCWNAEQRGRALAIYSVAPLIGPAVGPIAGAWISQTTTWRWVFWSSSIFSIIIQGLGLIFLRETYAPKILQQKAKRLRRETGDANWHVAKDPKADPDPSLLAKLRTSIQRPIIMLTTQSIVIVVSLYMAYVYGITYLVLSSFASLFTSPAYYSMPVGIAGLNYIALGLGYVTGAELTARLNDRTYRNLKRKTGSERGQPEFRVPGMVPCAILLPIGFLFYGWTAATHQHWILPDIGAFLIAVGTVSGMQSMQAYVVDTYTRYAASAMAAAMVLRSLAGFGFPLFAPIMYESLGYGWGNTVLAGAALALGVPAPLLLWKYGKVLREGSQFAAGGEGGGAPAALVRWMFNI